MKAEGVPDERAEALARSVQVCRQGRSFYRHVATPADAARFHCFQREHRRCEFEAAGALRVAASLDGRRTVEKRVW